MGVRSDVRDEGQVADLHRRPPKLEDHYKQGVVNHLQKVLQNN